MASALSISLLGLLYPLSSLAAPVSFAANSTFVLCPAASGPITTPAPIANFAGGKLLLAPTGNEGDLCILSRVDRDNGKKKVYIPISRSYDGSDWHRVRGKYVDRVSVLCGESTGDGNGYSFGDYLCEVTVPMMNEGNVGYFLTKWEEGVASDRRLAARFLEKATWGAT